jgi:3-hydroxybutyryl-CoA dehydrogenase
MNIKGLKVAQEGIATLADIDDIMREQAGFRMGPFELMDLTGLDVSHPVMESIYRQFYDEARFRPSPITALRAIGGLLGRKSGEGFYRYADGKKITPASTKLPDVRPKSVWVSPADRRGHAMVSALLSSMGAEIEDGLVPSDQALIVVTPLGTDATTCAVAQNLDARRVVAIDTLLPVGTTKRRTIMTTPVASAHTIETAAGLFASDGVPVTVIADSAGFVAQRIICAIINIACDIAQQRIAPTEDIDIAVKLGLGYPQGPRSMGDSIGPNLILETLRNLEHLTRHPRYRPRPWLWRRAGLGMSLLTH